MLCTPDNGDSNTGCFSALSGSSDNLGAALVSSSDEPINMFQRQTKQHQQQQQQQQKQQRQRNNGHLVGEGEKHLAEQLQQLSVEEREQVLHDLHGIEECPETPELIQESLQQMEDYLTTSEQIQNIPERRAYDLAHAQNVHFVQDSKLRLQFLRSEHFQIPAAVDRLFRFLEQKLQLFGLEKLCQKITLQDLSPADMAALKSGTQQVLPQRDCAGRMVVGIFPSLLKYKQVENTLRACYYTMMSCLEDEETQKKGVVDINYLVSSPDGKPAPPPDHEFLNRITPLMSSIPYIPKGIHFCTDSRMMAMFQQALVKLIERQLKTRARVHYGSHFEIMYKLMTFGIPVNEYPVSDTGSINIKKWHKWITTRKKIEAKRRDAWTTQHQQLIQGGGILYPVHHMGINHPNNSNNDNKVVVFAPDDGVVVLPSRDDVLFGRGKPTTGHPGNVSLNGLVESLLEEYNKRSKPEKTALAQDIVNAILQKGGRFLKQDKDGIWTIAKTEDAREKVSKTFWSCRGRTNNNSNNNTTNTNTLIGMTRVRSPSPLIQTTAGLYSTNNGSTTTTTTTMAVRIPASPRQVDETFGGGDTPSSPSHSPSSSPSMTSKKRRVIESTA